MPGNFPAAPMKCAISLGLTFLLAAPQIGRGQAPAKLNLIIVEGDGAINNIKQRSAREPIVQVEDENHRPVAGATVLFLLPDSGPGGVFANGSHQLTVTTDSQGRAVAKGLRLNRTSGKFQIQVQASYQGVTTSATITQTNAVITGAAAGGMSGKLIAILVIAGGAAAAGAVAATRSGGGSSSSTTPPTTVSAGAPSVGHP
jgi:hypothetical protein